MKKIVLLVLLTFLIAIVGCSKKEGKIESINFFIEKNKSENKYQTYIVKKDKKIKIKYQTNKATHQYIKINGEKVYPNKERTIQFKKKGTYDITEYYNAICKPQTKCPILETTISKIKVN